MMTKLTGLLVRAIEGGEYRAEPRTELVIWADERDIRVNAQTFVQLHEAITSQ